MKVAQVMTQGVQVAGPQSTLREAAQLMDSVDTGALPVCDGERLIGMITDRDIVIRSVLAGQDPATVLVREAMTAPIDYCFDDIDIEEAGRKMMERRVRRLAVINRSSHRLVGMLSLGDLAVVSPDESLSEGSERPGTILRTLDRSRLALELSAVALGAVFGAGMMFLVDPQQGRRRRALLRDQMVHYDRMSRHFFQKKARHASNRLRGIASSMGMTWLGSSHSEHPHRHRMRQTESHYSGIVSAERNRVVEEHFREHPEGDPSVRRVNPGRDYVGRRGAT